MTSAVIDFEGFQLSSELFVVKELAVCAVNDDSFRGRWLFKPPHCFDQLPKPKQCTYSWVTKNIHKIKWESGELPYFYFRYVLDVIMGMFTYIYVKGLQKKKFFHFLTGRDILNLDDVKCPKVNDLYSSDVLCPFSHEKNFNHCAVYKARVYGKFLETV
ncbi:uncharacterized protein TNCV_2560981 [Trichonephila clavipes]|uniref:Uncharacterized protein n=1 Tax=Trichonephila clavipes TaxID=2585209 RepID=A0A8X6R0R3_TRICX|nr:uncharacterized protein TNCV_2560981 [Trichonephila clavipes]